MRHRLLNITALAARYCAAVESAAEYEQREFIAEMLQLLPRLYVEFNDLVPGRKKKNCSCRDKGEECDCGHDHNCDCDHDHHCNADSDSPEEESILSLDGYDEDEATYYPGYIDEDYYENVRRHIETLMGADDIFLETFEEDMKYSDTPIAASISECLADIFQPLYNFISIVKESEGTELEGAYKECHDNFVGYWSQTLCNVMRALNNIFYNSTSQSESEV